MNVNSTAIAAAIISLIAFALTYRHGTKLSRRARILWLIGVSILSIPGASFAFYYTHLLPETSWYYQFRSITGTEFLVIPLGIVGGLIAASLPRPLLIPRHNAQPVPSLPNLSQRMTMCDVFLHRAPKSLPNYRSLCFNDL